MVTLPFQSKMARNGPLVAYFSSETPLDLTNHMPTMGAVVDMVVTLSLTVVGRLPVLPFSGLSWAPSRSWTCRGVLHRFIMLGVAKMLTSAPADAVTASIKAV